MSRLDDSAFSNFLDASEQLVSESYVQSAYVLAYTFVISFSLFGSHRLSFCRTERIGKRRARREKALAAAKENENDGKVDIEELENRPRNTQPGWSQGTAGRLPLKMADGSIAAQAPRPVVKKSAEVIKSVHDSETEEEEDEDASDESDDDSGDVAEKAMQKQVKNDDPDYVESFAALKKLPEEALFARRTRRKVLIAELAQKIIADPQNNISASNKLEKESLPFGKRGAKGSQKTSAPVYTSKRNSLLALHTLCSDADPLIRKLALLSLTTVFKDIVPGYRIRPPTAAEMASKISKDVKKLRDFESNLLVGYQRYLRLLEHTVQLGERRSRHLLSATGAGVDHVPATRPGEFDEDRMQDYDPTAAADDPGAGKKRERQSQRDFEAAKMAEKRQKTAEKIGLTDYDADAETVVALGFTALECMGDLLSSLPHFNFRTNLISFLVPRSCAGGLPASFVPTLGSARASGASATSEIVCAAFEKTFNGDYSFEAPLEIIRALSALAKECTTGKSNFGGKKSNGGSRSPPPRLRSRMLRALLALPLGFLEHAPTSRDSFFAQGLRKGKRRNTKEEDEDILAGLKAADAESIEDRKSAALATLRNVITIYFRILRSPAHAYLLTDVLTGLAKWAPLIDVGVVHDLLNSLKDLLRSSEGDDDADASGAAPATTQPRVRLPLSSALNCILTALRVINAPKVIEVLNVDEGEFAKYLYSVLLRLLHPGAMNAVPAGSEGSDKKITNGLLAIQAVQALLMNRREYSNERLTSFMHRILLLAMHSDTPTSLAWLSLARSLLHRYAALQSFFTPYLEGVVTPHPEQGFASTPVVTHLQMQRATALDVTLGVMEDRLVAKANPDRVLGLQATAWVTADLAMRHFHPGIRAFSNGCNQMLSMGPGEQPFPIYNAYDDSKGDFNPPLNPPAPHTLQTRLERARKEAEAKQADAGKGKGEKGKGGKEDKAMEDQDVVPRGPQGKYLFVSDRAVGGGLHMYTSVLGVEDTVPAEYEVSVSDCESEIVLKQHVESLNAREAKRLRSACKKHFNNCQSRLISGAEKLLAQKSAQKGKK